MRDLYRILAAVLCSVLAAQTPDTALADSVKTAYDLAHQFRHRGKYREAETKFQEALEAERRMGPPASSWAAQILDDLGSTYLALREDLKAEKHYLRSIRTWEKVAGHLAGGLVTPLNNFALLYLGQGRYAEAERLLLRAIKILKTHAGPDHPDAGRSL